MCFAWNHSLLIRRVQALHGTRLPAQQQPLWKEDNSDLWKYLDSLTRIIVHNLPLQSAIFPPKLNHGACLSGFHSSSLPAFVDLSGPPPPCPPSPSHVSVEARQLLLIILTRARGRFRASVMDVAYKLWVHPPLCNLTDKMRQIKKFCWIVINLVILSLKTRTNWHIGTCYVVELCGWACAFLLAVTTRNHGAESGEQVPAWTKDWEWFIWWHLSW